MRQIDTNKGHLFKHMLFVIKQPSCSSHAKQSRSRGMKNRTELAMKQELFSRLPGSAVAAEPFNIQLVVPVFATLRHLIRTCRCHIENESQTYLQTSRPPSALSGTSHDQPTLFWSQRRRHAEHLDLRKTCETSKLQSCVALSASLTALGLQLPAILYTTSFFAVSPPTAAGLDGDSKQDQVFPNFSRVVGTAFGAWQQSGWTFRIW